MGIKSTQKYVREKFGGEFVSGKYEGYHTTQFGDASPSHTGHSASGGIINDYTEPTGKVYRSHVFTSSGTFQVTALGTFPSHIEYLVVAGGGGAGGTSGGGGLYHGGGGAGGARTNLSGHPAAAPATVFPVSVATYRVIVGGGGNGMSNNGTQACGAGVANTGGGGGGVVSSPGTSPNKTGGAGGSGIVIIRYKFQ